jgi:hypothetical protein
MTPEAIGRCGYEWNTSATPPRLVRRAGPLVLRPRWPYGAAALAIGAVYVVTNLRGSPPLLLLGAFGELPALWIASWLSVNVEGSRKRRWVLRDLEFAGAGDLDGYRGGRAADVIVDGENVGQATSVNVVRWRRHEAGIHGEHRVVFRYEVSIVTARGPFALHEGAEEEPARALAQHLVETLGHGVPLVDRTEDAPAGPSWVLWGVVFVTAAVVTPTQMGSIRRGLIAAAVGVAVLSNVAATSVWIASRGRRHLHTTYGVPESSIPKLALPFRYALAFAFVAHALLWLSILAPGGPHIPPR